MITTDYSLFYICLKIYCYLFTVTYLTENFNCNSELFSYDSQNNCLREILTKLLYYVVQ